MPCGKQVPTPICLTAILQPDLAPSSQHPVHSTYSPQCLQKAGEEAAKLPPDRTTAYTGTYANACKELGKELGLPVVDLWTKMQQGEVRRELGCELDRELMCEPVRRSCGRRMDRDAIGRFATPPVRRGSACQGWFCV